MAKLGKEVENKKHKVRFGFIVSAIVFGVVAISVGAVAATSASPILWAMEGAILAAGAGLGVTAGIGISKAHEKVVVSINTSNAEKALQEIEKLNKDYSSTATREYRSKIVKKYANANLKLAKTLGASRFGVYRSNTGVLDKNKAQQVAGLSAEIDSLAILRDETQNLRKVEKYSKKIKLANEKISKIIEDDGLALPPYRWTKTYNDVLPTISVVDRRTEIACLTENTKYAYATMFGYTETKSDDKILDVVVNFNQTSGMAPTYARAEDQSKIEDIRKLMLKDVYEACKSKTVAQIRSMFPISVDCKLINKKTTDILNSKPLTYQSFTELEEDYNKSMEK